MKFLEYFKRKQIMFFVDTEISTYPPTGLPNKEQWCLAVIQSLVSLCPDSVPKISGSQLSAGLQLEELQRILEQELGDAFLHSLEIFRSTQPNNIHRYLARAIASQHLPVIIHLGWDDAMELALQELGLEANRDYYAFYNETQLANWSGNYDKPIILYLRGSIRDPSGIVKNLDQYQYGLGSRKIELLSYLLRRYYSVFLGMDGVFPYLHHFILETLPCSCPGILVVAQNTDVVQDIERAIRLYGHQMEIQRKSQLAFLEELAHSSGELMPILPPPAQQPDASITQNKIRQWAEQLGEWRRYQVIAALLERVRQYNTALCYRQQALEIVKKQNEQLQMASIYRKIGLLYGRTQQPGLANENLQKSLVHAEQNHQANEISLVHITRASLATDWKMTEREYQIALDIATQNQNQLQAGEFCTRLSDLYEKQHQFDLALECCQKAISHYQPIQQIVQIARIHNQMGRIYFGRQDLNKAKEHYLQAQDLAWRYGDIQTVARVYTNLAVITQKENDYFGAQRLYWRAGVIMERIGEMAGAALVYHNLALLKYGANDLGGTKKYLERSLAFWEQSHFTKEAEQAQRCLRELELHNRLVSDATVQLA